MDKYLIKVEGQGDTEIILIDKDMWDWLHSDAPAILFKNKSHCCMDDSAPESLKKLIIEGDKAVALHYGDEDEEEENGNVRLSSGAWRNDRALAIIRAFSNTDQPAFFMGCIDLINYCKENDINLVAEWEGCIY